MVVLEDMTLSPNVGSDRSWVYSTQADVSEGEPTAETLAIRFANTKSKQLKLLMCIDADEFKTAFEKAREENTALFKH